MEAISRYYRMTVYSYLVILAVSLLTSLYFFLSWVEEKEESTSDLNHVVASQFDRHFEDSSRFLTGARYLAESALQKKEETPAKLPPILRDRKDQYYLNWSQMIDGDPDKFGTTCGYYRTGGDEHLKQEWSMIKSLNGVMSVAQGMLPESIWIYYLSREQFIHIYPPVSPKNPLCGVHLLSSQVFRMNTPETNPDQSVQTTNAAQDMAGKGVMFSHTVPVYANGEFRGVLGIDFRTRELSAMAQRLLRNKGEFVLFDKGNSVLAHSSFVQNLPEKAYSVQDMLPKSLSVNAISMLRSGPKKGYVGGYYVETQTLETLPWTLVYYQEASEFIAPIFLRFIIQFLILFGGLSCLLSLVYSLTRRIFVKPASQLIHYIEQAANGDVVMRKPAPLGWETWFNSVYQAFIQNKELMRHLRDQNRRLDYIVEEKTNALKRSTEAKERNLALLKSIIRAIPDLIFFKNVDGTYLGCNRAYEAFLGVKEEQIIGSRASGFFNREKARLIDEEDQMVLDEGCSSRRSELVTYPDGSQKYLDILITPFFNEQEKMLGVIGIGRDITELHETLRALRQSENKFRSAIEYAANGICLLSPEFAILQVNDAFSDIFSLTDKQAYGRYFPALFSPEERAELTEDLQRLLVVEWDSFSKEFRARTEDNREVWILLSASLVWDEQKQPLYIIVHLQDISERRLIAKELSIAKEEAERANNAKGQFIANMSHEIRTPMNAVMGMLQLLETTELNAQQRDFVKKAERSGNALMQVINDILDFSKMEVAKLQLKHEPFYLSEVIIQAVMLNALTAQQKGIFIDYKLDLKLPEMCIGDSIRLGQVFTNLLHNAVKFTDSGKITIGGACMEKDEQSCELYFFVEDTGIGISEEMKPRLFSAFEQGDSSITRQCEGSGLGLAICQAIIRLMGGSIHVKSTQYKGARFEFTVKLKHVPAKAISPDWKLPLQVCLDISDKQVFIAMKNKLRQLQVTCLSVQDIQQSQYELADILIVTDQYETLQKLIPPEWLKQISIQYIDTGKNQRLPNELPFPVIRWPVSAAQLRDFWRSSNRQHLQENIRGGLLEGKRILIAEDNEVNQQLVELMLLQAGATVTVVSHGQAALEVLHKEAFDAVLLDVQMPGMDGLSTARAIRVQQKWSRLPILAMTAHCSEEDKIKSERAGMDTHLTKPILRETLYQMLSMLIHQGRRHQIDWFDWAFALKQTQDDRHSLLKLLQTFIQRIEGEPERMLEAFRLNQRNELKHRVHTLKGMVGNLGLVYIYQEVQTFEDEWRNESVTFERLIPLIDALYFSIEQMKSLVGREKEIQEKQISTDEPV